MSKSDYIAIARIIAAEPSSTVRNRLSARFADTLRADNPRFDPKRFFEACGASAAPSK